MARQLTQHKPTDILVMPNPIYYDGSEEQWESYEDLFGELDLLKEIVNQNHQNAKRVLKSQIGFLEEAIDRDKEFKMKMTGKNIAHNAIQPQNVEWGRKPFTTNLTFWTDYSFGVSQPGVRLRWGADGQSGVNANIFFAPYDDPSFVNIVSAGTFSSLTAQTRVFYIEPRLSNFSTIMNTTSPGAAARDGNIVLCMARSTAPSNIIYEYSLYGGGVHIVE